MLAAKTPSSAFPVRRSELTLRGVLGRSGHAVAVVALASCFTNLLALVSPLFMMQVYDRVLTSRSEMTLWLMLGAALGLTVVLVVLDDLRNRLLVRVGVRIDTDLHHTVFRAIFRRSLLAPDSSRARALQDIGTIRAFASGSALVALFDLPWTPLYVIVCWAVHPLLALVAIASAVLLLGITGLTEVLSRPVLERAGGESGLATAFAEASLRNAEVIEAMGMLPSLERRWGSGYRKSIILQAQASDRAAALSAASKFVQQASQLITLGLGALLVIQHAITPGLMIICTMVVARALMPINQLVGSWKSFVAARGAARRLARLLQQYARETGERVTLPRPDGEVRVDGIVVARAGGGPAILKGVSVTIPPGTLLGVIGPSGSGKTTFARAVLGVIQPAQGIVRLDGASILDWDRGELGPFVGYLPQDIELFDGTVAENIARFGMLDSERIIEAANLAGVHALILSMPDGYETRIGELGATLSAGQRQRIGLARALYGRPSLVVLDEPNSNLDAEGEQALHRALGLLRERRTTVIVIAHRSSILGTLDRLLVLKDGLVEASGATGEIIQRLTRPVAAVNTGTGR